MSASTKRLWWIEAAGNLMLLAFFYIWLGIHDARAVQLMGTVVLGGLIAFLALWLHAANFTYFSDGQPESLTAHFRDTLRRIGRFATVVIVFLALWWALDLLREPLRSAAQLTASTLTFRARKPVRPATVAAIYFWALWIVQRIVLPVAMLPLATRSSPSLSRKPRFWFEYLLTAIAGFYLPWRLIHYAPALHNTAGELASFLIRFALAYFLLVTGWLALAFFSSGGRPRASQPSTAGSP